MDQPGNVVPRDENGDFKYRTGCTVLIDPATQEVRRVIRTAGTVADNTELDRIRRYLLGETKDFEIRRAWFAWTEDPVDPDANELRRRHKDQLPGLVEARRHLAPAVGDDEKQSSVAPSARIHPQSSGGKVTRPNLPDGHRPTGEAGRRFRDDLVSLSVPIHF